MGNRGGVVTGKETQAAEIVTAAHKRLAELDEPSAPGILLVTAGNLTAKWSDDDFESWIRLAEKKIRAARDLGQAARGRR